MPLATALRSIVDHTPLRVDFHILFDRFPSSTRLKVEASLPPGAATIHWHRVDVGAYDSLFVMEHTSPMTFARLLIPDTLSPTITRVLYLDADLVALASVKELAEIDLRDHLVAAVRDELLDTGIPEGLPGSHGAPRVERYFNAGVLVIDVAKWRQERVAQAAHGYLVRHPQSPFMDQDGLNVVCDGRWLELDARWNFQGHVHRVPSSLHDSDFPWIVHFVTGRKPWHPSARSPWAQMFDLVRSRTEFARSRTSRLHDAMIRFGAGARNRASRAMRRR